ncbi:glomulin-like isoform X1 [Palaemon carinicauda]|uniref:glomulin-like isoform X1 n=1 Tax=Palaemon carinicauda TaxID=392227 RepID=UPI0035B5B4C5
MNGISGIKVVQGSSQEDLESILWNKLRNERYAEALDEVKDEKYHQYLVHNSLELVPVVLKYLLEDPPVEGEKCVEDILMYIASVANGKEALIVFLEELEMNRCESYFRVLLQPMKTLLLREVTEKTRSVMFSWVFNTLYSHVVTLDLPKNFNLEGEERKLLDLHPEVQALTRTLQWLTDFYAVFYEKVISGELTWGGKVKNSRHYLAFFLLQLFDRPLTYLDVYCAEGEVENSLYRTCQKLASMIAHLYGNSFSLFAHISWNKSKTVLASDDKSVNSTEDSEELDIKDGDVENEGKESTEKSDGNEKESVSQLSLACYFYCILSQDMASDFVPFVYSHQFVFLNCLPLICHLLELTDDIAIHKALMLSKALLNKIAEFSLPNECLEAKAHSSFPQLLIRVMTYSDNFELRKTALDIFRPYLRKFERTGRRNLLKCLLVSVKHAGVLSVVIHELKENVSQCLNEEVMDTNFCGKNLEQLILLACFLPDGETTDLLEWSDGIMAALNFLIFLFVRDKENRTCVKKVVPVLQDDFLAKLRKGLELSRAHYELKLRELVTPGKRRQKPEMSVAVKGVMLPNMPPDQEEKVLKTALCSFDMMQCVLARVDQVVH